MPALNWGDEDASSFGDTESEPEEGERVEEHWQGPEGSGLGAALSAEWRSWRRPEEWRLNWIELRQQELRRKEEEYERALERCTEGEPSTSCARTTPWNAKRGLRRRRRNHARRERARRHPLSGEQSQGGGGLHYKGAEAGSDADLSIGAIWGQLARVEAFLGSQHERLASHLDSDKKKASAHSTFKRNHTNQKKHRSRQMPPQISIPSSPSRRSATPSSRHKVQIVTPGVRRLSESNRAVVNADEGESSEDTHDEAYLSRHAPLERQERARLQAAQGPSLHTRQSSNPRANSSANGSNTKPLRRAYSSPPSAPAGNGSAGNDNGLSRSEHIVVLRRHQHQS